ncbi:MAG: polysaccharide deacetylase family protein [Pseudomonadales bacterium]
MTNDDLHALYESDVEIAAHTVARPILGKISARQAQGEIEGRRDYLLHLGFPQQSFCFTNSRREDYNETKKAVLQQTGYLIAFTIEKSVNYPQTNSLELRQMHAFNVDSAALKYRFSRTLLYGETSS